MYPTETALLRRWQPIVSRHRSERSLSIEVLKGPQGTLYGSDSLGGLIKYVTKKSSTDGFSGGVQVQGEDVDHGGVDTPCVARSTFLCPIRFAVRASGFTRRDAGYIENISTGNATSTKWMFVAAIFPRFGVHRRPSRSRSVCWCRTPKATEIQWSTPTTFCSQPWAIYNRPAYTVTGHLIPRSSFLRQRWKAKLGGVDFVSLSGYGINKWYALYDIIRPRAGFCRAVLWCQRGHRTQLLHYQKVYTGVPAFLDCRSMAGLDGGTFYTHEDSGASFQNLEANDYATGAPSAS